MAPEAVTPPAAEAQYAGYSEEKPGKWVVEAFLAPPAPSGCEPSATLYANGVSFKSANGTGRQVWIELTGALDPTVSWTVRMAWTSGGTPGPQSAALELPVVPPLLRSAAADAGVAVAWDVLPGPPYPTGVQLLLKGGNETSAAEIIGAEQASCSPQPPLKEGVVYSATVAALRGRGEGPPSEPVLVPFVRTALASAAYDGKALTVTWAGSDPAGTTGCRIELLKGAAQVGEFAGAGGKASAEVALDPAAYQVRLRWLAGRGSGPAGATLPVLSAAPALEKAEVLTGAKEVKLTWTAPAGTVTGYVAVFRCEGAADSVVPLAAGATSPAKVALPAAAVDPLGRATVALRAKGSGSEGPPSAALPVLVPAPALEAIEYDGSRVSISAAPIPGAVDGYATRASWDPATVIASAGPSVSFPASPPLSTAAYVEIAARRGAGLGPSAVAGGTALVLGAPEIKERAFDGSRLTVAVIPSTAPGGSPTGYRVELLRGAVVVERAELPAPATGQPLTMPVGPLEQPAATHTVRVRTRSGISLGPAAEAPVTLAAPSVGAVVVAAEIEALVLAGALPASGLTMQARLVVDGNPGAPVAVDSLGKVKFAVPVGETSWAVAARATYANVTGPWSEQVAVPSTSPQNLAAEYSEGRLRAWWSGDSDATYLASVFFTGGSELAGTRVRGTAAEFRFAPPAAMVELRVQLLAGIVTGPASGLKLVTTALAASAVTSEDQSAVTVSWRAGTIEPPPSGFVPVIAWDGERRELPAVAATASSATVPLAGVPAGAVVGVRVRAGSALGPLGQTAPVVPGRPTDLSLGWEGGELAASWTSPEGPWGEGAVVDLKVGTNTTELKVYGNRRRLSIATGTEEATLAVAALAAAGTGAATTAPVLFAAPAISKVAWDGQALTVGWAAAGGKVPVNAYLVTVSDRGRVLAERTVAASPATLAVSGLSSEATVSVAALATGADWPRWRSLGPAAQVAVTVAAPAVAAVTVDPVSGAATASWPPLASATYALLVYLDGALAETLPTSETSAKLKTAPAAGQELAVAVRAIVTVSGVPREGPPGPRLAVLTDVPEIAAVEFDGVAATVRWRSVAAAGYAVAVFGGSTPAVLAKGNAPAGATSLRLAAEPKEAGYQVAVQARRGANTGVRATAALFQPGLYVRPSASGPAILGAATEKLEAAAITVYLPPLGKAALSPMPIEPAQAGTTEPPFKLTENIQTASKATLPYLLTIGAGALAFDANRPALASTYAALLRAAESAGAGPQGIFALQQAISRLMPQTFAETLYYAYGLAPLRGCVDLRPGMILRLAASGFDLTAVDSVPPPAGWATGYAPAGAIDLAIDDYLSGGEAKWRVGFDSFLATLAASGALEVPAPEATGPGTTSIDVVETGGSDAADLFFEVFRNPYYRLLVPAAVQAASKPTTPRTSQQFAIASAPSWAQIDAGNPPGSEVKVAYFRGRAVLRPCIRVEVDGRERVVPVGTTVGNLLDGLGRRPPSTARPLTGLRLQRSLGPAVLDPTTPYDAGACTRVNLDWHGLVTTAPGVDALSLPLLHGDRLGLGEEG